MNPTDQRISEIEARCEKATPGEWFVNNYRATIGQQNPAEPIHQGRATVLLFETVHRPPAEADKQFIAHSRSDIPWLVSELKRARELPAILFDGHAVLTELQKDPRASKRTSWENVGDVLDAVVRIARAALADEARKQ